MLKETTVETYRIVSGLMNIYRIRRAKIALITKDIELKPIESYIVISCR
ncbi:MAG: hypothetical protein ACP5IZ_01965 [Thermoprotei archaeon]|jgi:hypothetical protein